MTHQHTFEQHCGMPHWTICSCGVYGPETQAYLNGVTAQANGGNDA